MELKTQIIAEKGRQDLYIHREFDLPVHLLFLAYSEANCLEQWMGTKVLKLECEKHGSYLFETTDPKGGKHRFSGVFHNVKRDNIITRTFEMEDTPFPVQLEFLVFKKLTEESSKLEIHTVFKSIEDRDKMLQLPFAKGLSLAHNRLEELLKS